MFDINTTATQKFFETWSIDPTSLIALLITIGGIIIVRIYKHFNPEDESDPKNIHKKIVKLKKKINDSKQEEANGLINFKIETLHLYYELAKLYNKLPYFKEISIVDEKKEAIGQIELRLNTLSLDKDKANVYNYLATYYQEKNLDKSLKYNTKAMDYIESLETDGKHSVEHLKAKICYRQAISFYIHQENQKASEQLKVAIRLEPNNDTYKLFGFYIRIAKEKQKAFELLKQALTIEPHNDEYKLLKFNILIAKESKTTLSTIPSEVEPYITKFKSRNDTLMLYESYRILAIYYKKAKDEASQKEYLNKAWEMLKDTDLIVKKRELQADIEALDDEKKALRNFDKSLNLSFTDIPYYLELARELNNKGVELYKMGDYPKALEYHQKALAIREKVLGVNHPDIAQSYNNIGTLYYLMEDLNKAQEYVSKAIEIWQKALPANHPDLLDSQKSLKIIEEMMN